jgi:hypothetical protein
LKIKKNFASRKYIPVILINMAKFLMIIGGAIFTVGLIWFFFGSKLHWIGRLPGDIRIEKENFKFYFPLTTMILFSLLLTLLVNIFKRLF